MALYGKRIPSTASPEKCRDQDPIGGPWNAQQEETYHDAKSGHDDSKTGTRDEYPKENEDSGGQTKSVYQHKDHEREENKDESMNVVTPRAVAQPTSDYKRLKRTLKTSTTGWGTALSASYFVTQGADQGVSAVLGAVASYAYVSLLCDRVDTFEETTLQKEFFAPLGAAAFEVAWNNAPFAFDFDYGATFVGFLAYKFALTTVIWETVREMMLNDDDE